MNTAYEARKTFYNLPANTLTDKNGTALTFPNVKMNLNSGYRNPERQERWGTAINSHHQEGDAVDFGFRLDIDFQSFREKAALYQLAWEAGINVVATTKQLESRGIKLNLGSDTNGNNIDDAYEDADHFHID